MDNQIISMIQQGNTTAFIDGTITSNLAYRPQFVSNNYKEGRKVISSIEEELLSCEEFSISVAFITMSGITPFLQTFKTLENRGIHGRILTTDYLMFSDPKALDKLAELSNIEVRMYHSKESEIGFHTKGYIFRNSEIYSVIVGSSNMTLSALTQNKEWNTRLVSTGDGEFIHNVLKEYDELWTSEYTSDYDKFIDNYKTQYEIVKKQRKIAKTAEIPSLEQYRLQPNSMQVEFISSLKEIIDQGKQKALLISATGTGKTYASAFALREFNPKRALFLVHREQIAKQAVKSYRNVFGKSKSLGLLSGNSKSFDADLIFATMQTMSKSDILKHFCNDEFDVIVIDEVHRAAADSYQKIMNYFYPKFWLGMTASPERMDGFDIFALFDHNIAYEIRLQQALEENLLCPFHYFGITDLEINGEVFDDNAGVRNFSNLVCDDRVNYIINQAEYYGYSGDRVKGLIFCSRKEEAAELSRKFNLRGYNTAVLTGGDSQEKREDCIEKLTRNITDMGEEHLDYIFTIDIFNEGVDIPAINQVIMLRPTQSPTIFVQQLGRGLRKAEDKEYVVILDFIGNYMNNFMIPIALSGDRTYNKDNIRKYVREGSRVIPGSSTIHFDEISKKRIFESIDKAQTNKKFLQEKYQLLKNRLGRIPNILDFYEYGEIDPQLFIDYSRSYDKFVRSVDKEYTITFSQQEEAVLEFVSLWLVNGKRPHELILLSLLMNKQSISKQDFEYELSKYGYRYSEKDYMSALNLLDMDFINTQSERKKYSTLKFFDEQAMRAGSINRANSYMQWLKNLAFRNEIDSLIEYGLKKCNDCYRLHDGDNLVLYEKYSRKDICRILNWEKDDSSTVYGYRIKHNTCPIFVTYHKKEDIASSTKYEDQFINEQLFSWMTRSKVGINSPESQQLIHYKDTGLKIYLFIKKSDGEGSDFYYMGRVVPINWCETVIKNDKGKELPIMNFQLKLENIVRKDIYEYFTE